MQLNKKELSIMSVFRNNARENLTTVSRRLHIPVSTLYDRLRKYQKSVFLKHTTLLDFYKLGYKLKVLIAFKTNIKNKDLLQKFLENHHQINSIYKTSSEYDFLIEIILKDLSELDEFYTKLDQFGIKSKQEFYILRDIKREAFLTDSYGIDMIADKEEKNIN